MQTIFVSAYPSTGNGHTVRPVKLIQSLAKFDLTFRVENVRLSIPGMIAQLRGYYPDARLVLVSPLTRLVRVPTEVLTPTGADIAVLVDPVAPSGNPPAVVTTLGGVVQQDLIVFEPTEPCHQVVKRWQDLHKRVKSTWNATLMMAMAHPDVVCAKLPDSVRPGNMLEYVTSKELLTGPSQFSTEENPLPDLVTPAKLPHMPIPTCQLPLESESTSEALKFGSFSFFGKTRTMDLLARAGWKQVERVQLLTSIEREQQVSQIAKRLVDGGAQIAVVDNFAVKEEHMDALRAAMPDVVHVEDGWFDHAETVHCDPLGFCWRSSLCRMEFPGLVTDAQVRVSEDVLDYMARRSACDEATSDKMAEFGDYVLWPLQLLQDRVNTFGENAYSWVPYIKHARKLLPAAVKLLVKPHPRDAAPGSRSLSEIAELAAADGGVVLLPPKLNLASCLAGARGVVGMNSTVLYEARLIFGLPIWAYADSWYSNHDELFYRLKLDSDSLPHAAQLEDRSDLDDMDEYARWFIYQLAARQFMKDPADADLKRYVRHLRARSYQQWVRYGPDMFG